MSVSARANKHTTVRSAFASLRRRDERTTDRTFIMALATRRSKLTVPRVRSTRLGVLSR
jgi:hypothetical protein